jgi:hypothetical protein
VADASAPIRPLYRQTRPCPEHLLGCLWALEDWPEPPGDALPLVRGLASGGCWAGLAWAVALSWSRLTPDTRALFRDGRRDLAGWLNSLFLFWPNVDV